MNVLFVHQGFPGQYLHICRALAQQGNHRLVAMGMQQPRSPLPKGVQHVIYGASRGNGQDVHPLALETETKVIRAEACATAAEQLKRQGFRPDIICGHPGWGELLFLPHVWPDVPILMYQEFYYQIRGFDYDFDPEFQAELSWQKCAKAQMKNANTLLNLEAATWNLSPTAFQRSSFPERFHQRISVIHDGIDANAAPAKANAGLTLTLRDGQELRQGEPIITFVNRTIEPYRGCHSFIRAIPHIQELQPNARIVIVGAEQGVSYGSVCPQGEWKDRFMAEIEGSHDPSRLHFAGSLGYADFLTLLKLSQAHVYLTYPFVLSWSLLEAMSIGCAIVASDTAPLREVINHDETGRLVDFFDHQALADAVIALLDDPAARQRLGDAARAFAIAHYDLHSHCLPRQLDWVQQLASSGPGG